MVSLSQTVIHDTHANKKVNTAAVEEEMDRGAHDSCQNGPQNLAT
jgi:hypothetical protein